MNPSRPRGLTLIEILVALAVLGVLTAMGFRSMQTLTDTHFRLVERSEIQRREVALWRFVERDLEPLEFASRAALQRGLQPQPGGFQLPTARWQLAPEGLTRIDANGVPLVLMPRAESVTLLLHSSNAPQPQPLGTNPEWSVPPGALALEVVVQVAGVGPVSRLFALGPGPEGQAR